MQTAYHRCDMSNHDKILAELKEYYKIHTEEEMYHDEWLLDDLEEIGVSRQESLSKKPSQKVAELVGSQYYWINHWHPVCLLGYISFLEGNPPETRMIDRLEEITGYPKLAFRTIRKHSQLDTSHRDDLNRLLDTLPLTTLHEHWITYNALYSANKFTEIIRTID
jgi:hypothetical protein